MKFLMEIYPEFVKRRVSQVHDDFDFAIRNQMIDQILFRFSRICFTTIFQE